MTTWGRKVSQWMGGGRLSKKASAAGKLLGNRAAATFVSFAAPRWTGRSYEQLAREGYRKNAIVNRCVRIISESAASVPFILMRGDKPLGRHPLLDLLSRPNPLQSGKELFANFFAFHELAGNAYMEVVEAADNRVGELYVLRPERMKIIPGANGWPSGFIYKVGAKSHTFRVDPKTLRSPILHLRTFHPDDDYYGLSPLEAAAFGIELVSLKAGGNEKRFTCNGIIDPFNPHRQNLEQLTSAMAGTVVFQAGVWRIYTGSARIANISRTTEHVVGGVKLRAKKGISEKINSIKGTYPDLDADYTPKDYPPRQNQTYITEDGGLELWLDLDLPMTTSGPMAQRISKITLERARREKQLDLTFFPIALQDQAMDAINFSYAPFNINNQKFLIADWSLKFTNDDEGNMGFLVFETLIEEDDAIYAWTPATDELDIPVCGQARAGKRINDQRALPPVNVGGGFVSVSTNPLSAVDAGAAARIDVAQHDRHFGFGTVTYNAGSVTALSFSTLYYVYTDDPGLFGGSVTYMATTTKTDITDSNERLFIGEITTPTNGAGSTFGGGGGGIMD